MSKPWSKLKSQVMNLVDDKVDLNIHQAVYRMQSQRGSSDLPRYFVTLGKNIIFDYPKQFLDKKTEKYPEYETGDVYPHITDMGVISNLLREYVDTPLKDVLAKEFKDSFGITDLLKASDRRLGREKLQSWSVGKSEAVQSIIKNRFF